MKVTIWDLDYYYAAEKRNQFNPDVMKISSYHKQLGDQINFVLKEDDIYRPYDLYYIIKENNKTKNAPFDFYTNSKVRWWGKAYKHKINWKMSDVMLACRPDYLLYPEKNTVLERSEQLRLLNDKGELLPIKQEWRNSFKNKKVLITDTNLWTTSREVLIKVLKQLTNILNIAFFEPIWLPKIANDEELMQLFLGLHLQQGSNLTWTPIPISDYADCIAALERIKNKLYYVAIGPLPVKIYAEEHWRSPDAALADYRGLRDIILDSKKKKLRVEVKMLNSRLDTPYFLMFETFSEWTSQKWELSWLEWITQKYGPGLKFEWNSKYWNHPGRWSPVFRDLLRQTWEDSELLMMQWGTRSLSPNDIPWTLWKEEFKYGI